MDIVSTSDKEIVKPNRGITTIFYNFTAISVFNVLFEKFRKDGHIVEGIKCSPDDLFGEITKFGKSAAHLDGLIFLKRQRIILLALNPSEESYNKFHELITEQGTLSPQVSTSRDGDVMFDKHPIVAYDVDCSKSNLPGGHVMNNNIRHCWRSPQFNITLLNLVKSEESLDLSIKH